MLRSIFPGQLKKTDMKKEGMRSFIHMDCLLLFLFLLLVMASCHCFFLVSVVRVCCLLESMFVSVDVSWCRCLSELLFVGVVVCWSCCLSELMFARVDVLVLLLLFLLSLVLL
jgi:hypothetical protein